MVYVNECVTLYFLSKFLQPQLSLKLPIMEMQSSILTDELLAFFYLGNPFLQQSKRVKLLYSSGKHGFNFAEIVNGLIGLLIFWFYFRIFDVNNDWWIDEDDLDKMITILFG